jgi:hypothetical protein
MVQHGSETSGPRRKSEGSSSCSSIYCKKCGPVCPKGPNCPDQTNMLLYRNQNGRERLRGKSRPRTNGGDGHRRNGNGAEGRKQSPGHQNPQPQFVRTSHAVPKTGSRGQNRHRQGAPTQRPRNGAEERPSPYEELNECKREASSGGPFNTLHAFFGFVCDTLHAVDYGHEDERIY